MFVMKYLTCMWLILCTAICCYAQDIVVSGVLVCDSVDDKCFNIDIVQDNVCKRTLIVKDSVFSFSLAVDEVPCKINFRKNGYESVETSLMDDSVGKINLGQIRLFPLSIFLNGIDVVARKTVVQSKNGNLKVLVNGTYLE